jgi:hypothetical protein
MNTASTVSVPSARLNVDRISLIRHLVVALAFLFGAALVAFGPWLLGWWDTSPAIIMSSTIAAFLWRDWLQFIRSHAASERVLATCRVAIVAAITVTLFALAAAQAWAPLAYSVIAILSGILYRLTCGRLGTLQMEEDRACREEE